MCGGLVPLTFLLFKGQLYFLPSPLLQPWSELPSFLISVTISKPIHLILFFSPSNLVLNQKSKWSCQIGSQVMWLICSKFSVSPSSSGKDQGPYNDLNGLCSLRDPVFCYTCPYLTPFVLVSSFLNVLGMFLFLGLYTFYSIRNALFLDILMPHSFVWKSPYQWCLPRNPI